MQCKSARYNRNIHICLKEVLSASNSIYITIVLINTKVLEGTILDIIKAKKTGVLHQMDNHLPWFSLKVTNISNLLL